MTFSARRQFLAPTYPLSLLVGNILFDRLGIYLSAKQRSESFLKWPNDVLIDHKKVSGILIESTNSHFHIGIGINTVTAPQIKDGGRPSTSLFLPGSLKTPNSEIIETLAEDLQSAFKEPPPSRELFSSWSSKMDWSSPVFLREDPQTPLKPIRLDRLGRLEVEEPDGTLKKLNTQYLV